MNEHLDRLRYMAGPDSHEKWDLSENDKRAIQWAIETIEAQCWRPLTAQQVIERAFSQDGDL